MPRPPDGAGPAPYMLRCDGEGTPPPPDGQGIPPPPISVEERQVLAQQRADELTLKRKHDQETKKGVRKGLLKGNNTSNLSTPKGKERNVMFDLTHLADGHKPEDHRSSQSTDLVISGQPSTRGSSDVRDIYEHQYEECTAASDSGAKMARRQRRRGSQALSTAVDTPRAPPP